MAAPERWDEACFVVPALRALIASGLGVGILCPAGQRGFWQTLEGLEILTFAAKAKPKAVAAELRGNWQAALAWGGGLAAEAFQIAGIERRLGSSGEVTLKKRLTHPLSISVGPLEHRVRYYLAAVESLGVETARPEFFSPLAPGVDRMPGQVMLYPDSDFGPSHEWPLERWVEIGERLLEAGQRVTVGSLDDGRALGKNLAGRLGQDVELFQAAPLAGVFQSLSGHSLIVAADGSLPHLASHVGATCVVLFGPNDPTWKRPLGKRHAVVRRHVECAPCLLPKCPLDHRCQNELDVERVWQAILGKLA